MSHDHVLISVIDAEPPGGENVPARRLDDEKWEIIRSPLYATEVASGDVIKVTNAETGGFEIIRRSGNICIQFYLCEDKGDDAQFTSDLAEDVGVLIEPLNGRIDAITAGLFSLTIPAVSGFQAIEKVFEMAVEKCPGSQWQYANVYDTVTGEPLGWWGE
ncbi:DUF4265 domain-containing protein [Endozoicomonas sp. ALD040]|uniref:DUF4265 domain-containing protein n=1 Tax=Endozoicomonas sp. ALD040 TaxID=3403079 RepID=UPI003BB0F57D